MATTSSTGQVASRYAAALIDMAEQAQSVEKIEKDFADLEAMIASSRDLESLIRNPLLNRNQQQSAILAISAKAGFSPLTNNFLGVLAQNRRLPILNAVIRALKAELSRRRGQVEAKVETAFALSPAQTDALQKQLSKAMGTNVTLNVAVNKDLLGGMVVTVGSRMIDDSVRRKLERLQRTMSAGSNENQSRLKEVS